MARIKTKDPIDIFNPEVWLMLRELEKEYGLEGPNFTFKLRHHPETIYTAAAAIPSYEHQVRILELLQSKQLLMFKPKKSDKAAFEVSIMERKFKPFIKSYESKADQKLMEKEPVQIELVDFDGTTLTAYFYGRKEERKFGETNNQKIFEVLWRNRNSVSGHTELRKVVGKDPQAVSNAINELRAFLGDARKNGIIETDRGDGYMLKTKNF